MSGRPIGIRPLTDCTPYHWLPDDAFDRLLERANTDRHVAAIIACLRHCSTAEKALTMMADIIVEMSRNEEHLRKLTTSALLTQRRTPIIITNGQISIGKDEL